LNEIGFAKTTPELSKIKEMDLSNQDEKKYLQQGLSMIFTKSCNLIGLKDPISNINKLDIVEMILSRFKGLSLEEIDYAFRIDRYGNHGEPTPHYQLFNSEYVATVLGKYKNWLRKTRENNNLPISKPTEEKALTEDEKAMLIVNGIIECFEEYSTTGCIPVGKAYVYDILYKRGLFPVHTKRFREHIKRKAIRKRYKSRENPNTDRKSLKSILLQIQSKQSNQTVLCKEIILGTFFKKLIAQGKTISDVL